MRTEMFRWLVLAAGMLAHAGCQHGESVPVEANPVPPPRPFVFYDDTGDPYEHNPALSEREVQEIIAWVATQTSDPIWLIRVKSSNADGIHFGMVAHLVPDETSPRIRVGRAYDVPALKKQTGTCSPWEYAQVSMPGHDFDRQLTKPSVSEMPFCFPYTVGPDPGESSPMSKEEAIGILDFVRLPSAYKDVTAWGGHSKEEIIQAILRSPLLDIRREGNKINVRFGFIRGLLWGDGLAVTLERTPTGYEVKAWGSWIS